MYNTCSSFVFKILAKISSSCTDLSNYVKYWTFNKVKVVYYGFNHMHGLWKLSEFTFSPHPYPSSILQTENHQWTASYNKGVLYVLVFPNMQTGYIFIYCLLQKDDRFTPVHQTRFIIPRQTQEDLQQKKKEKKKKRIISKPPHSLSCINFIPASRQPYDSNDCCDCNVPHMWQWQWKSRVSLIGLYKQRLMA